MKTIIIVTISLALIALILSIAIFFYNLWREEKYIILFNRRTRKLTEVPSSEYKSSKSWVKIAEIEGSHLWDFLQYLRKKGVYDTFYKDSPSQAVGVLQWYFKKYISEINDTN